MKTITISPKYALNKNGFIAIPKMLPSKSTEEVAQEIGNIIELDNIPTTQTLQPKKRKDSSANLYSGNYGFGEYPFHTDLAHWYLPPRYLLLRCVVPAKDVCTFLIGAKKATRDLDESVIRRALFSPRKKLNGKKSLLRFYEKDNDYIRYRWDNLFIAPENDAARMVVKYLSQYTEKDAELKHYYHNQGDVLIVDNWRNFHGRSNVSELSKNRLIERVYLSEVIF